VRLFALLTLSLPPLYCSAQTYNNAHITKHVPQTATHAQTHFLAQTYIQKLITDSGDWLQKTVKVRRLVSLKVPGATTLNETTVLT
jgi:hypothetical protein